MVVLLGIDVHKATHTAVAVDEVGQKIGQCVVAATDGGHRQLLGWALSRWSGDRLRFAVEDCRQVSTRLERTLLGAGQTVVRVPPKLTAGSRSVARTRGKSDPIDALAIARAALREPDLPVATLDGQFREVRLLVDHREDLVAARTQMQNRLRWHLHELEPGREPGLRCLDRYCALDRLAAWLAGCEPSVLVRLASELVRDIRAHTVRINELKKELSELVTPLAPRLLELPGCGVLTAAKLIGEVGQVSRFRSESCFAMHAGVAPIPASSGKTTRYRLARGGNRQLNAALHRIALSQIRLGGPGSVYYQRRRGNGDTTMEAMRALKRRLARVVYGLLRTVKSSATVAEAA
jgi:transposase